MESEFMKGVERAKSMARGAWHTGMVFSSRPSGLLALARQRARGALGPSALYRVHAANHPDKAAVITATRRVSYAELDHRIDALATGLRRRGLGRGSAAVIVMPNCREFLEVQSAMARLGGSAVSVSYRSTAAELEYLVTHCNGQIVFVHEDVAAQVEAARPSLRTVRDGNYVLVGGARAGFLEYEALLAKDAEDVDGGEEGAVVIYTSGTTGKPKGAVRKFPKDTAAAVMRFLGETPIRCDDRHLAVCPMYHSTAFGFIGFTFVVGGTVVLDAHFDPERFLRLVEDHRITTTALVPTMLHRLVQLPDEVFVRYDTRSLRAVFSGGAPLSGTLARRFIDRFGPVLFNFFGATETGINTLANSDELLRSPGTIGHLVPGNEIRLLDDDGRDVPAGHTGELYVRNELLVAGYHEDDAATRASMRDGFFSVGDLAHRDANGLFHIDGRKRDMVISGGVNVYPVEVEAVLLAHPAVAEAAVIGVPDEEWGERVRGFVSLREGAFVEPHELVAYARARLSGPKVPKEIVILDELPKNPTGKTLKRELRELR